MANFADAATSTLNLRAEDSYVGKYTADPNGALETVLSHYDVKATSDGGTRFWTFCLESQVYFESDRTYNAEVSASTDSASGPDPLSVSTAYLYEQFALGQLNTLVTDFTYDVSGGARLQQMIWWLEGEGGVQDAAMWSLLNTTFGANALSTYTGDAVKVLNLTKYSGVGGDGLAGTARQDQLVYWGNTPTTTNTRPVPDGGTTLLLLGSALGGLGLVRRWTRTAKD
ncbi:MAG: hypothetical protein V4584_12285 [Verrucomicrobiota bacterium]